MPGPGPDYDASDTSRGRRSPDEMDAFRVAILRIVAANRPCSARQVYYRAVVAGLVTKDSAGTRASEAKVGRVLNELREDWLHFRADWHLIRARASAAGLDPGQVEADVCEGLMVMPFGWITDSTRVRYQAPQWDSKDEALEDWIATFRRNLWRSQPRRVEVWCESDSIAGVIGPQCNEYGVAWLPCRGQAPKRFVFDSAQSYAAARKPVSVLYVGDFDPAGLDIGHSVRDRLTRYLPPRSGIEVDFQRIAITGQQVLDDTLPGHGLNPRIAAPVLDRFIAECDRHGIPHEAVEAEAMPPDQLRALVSRSIRAHIDQPEWDRELAQEANDRHNLDAMLRDLGEQAT